MKTFNILSLYKNSSFVFASLLICLQSFHIMDNYLPLLILLLLGWRYLAEKQNRFLPSRWITNSLSILSLVFVFLQYKTLIDLKPASLFFFSLWGLKALEVRSLRDFRFLVLVSFILICTFGLMVTDFIFAFPSVLASYFVWKSQNTEFQQKLLWARALPLVLFLFFFFPRLQGQLAYKNNNQNFSRSQTGFSDDLRPGHISEIVNSKDLAFRVRFENNSLPTRDQYWIGQILTSGEGLTWKRELKSNQRAFNAKDIPEFRTYTVQLEPHNNRWLFSLENTESLVGVGFAVQRNSEGYFETPYSITDPITYTGHIQPPMRISSKTDLEPYLKTPEVSENLKQLAQQLKEKSKSREQLAFRVLRYYKNQNFKYARQFSEPISSLDQFFFKDKKGFCEHYAAATASLLRLMNVPSRVVTGYQGGEYNTYGNFWKFTQADAHAWTEFLDDQGYWQRLDAVNVVAPERLDFGGKSFLEVPEKDIGTSRSRDLLSRKSRGLVEYWDELTLFLEGLNYTLSSFLYDFDLNKQKELLQRLGLPTWVAILAGLAISFLLAILIRWVWPRRTFHESREVANKMDQFIAEFATPRPPYKTILSALKELADSWAKYKLEIEHLEFKYLAYTFANLSNDEKSKYRKEIFLLLKELRRNFRIEKMKIRKKMRDPNLEGT